MKYGVCTIFMKIHYLFKDKAWYNVQKLQDIICQDILKDYKSKWCTRHVKNFKYISRLNSMQDDNVYAKTKSNLTTPYYIRKNDYTILTHYFNIFWRLKDNYLISLHHTISRKMTCKSTILFQGYKTMLVHVLIDYTLHISFSFENMSHQMRKDI